MISNVLSLHMKWNLPKREKGPRTASNMSVKKNLGTGKFPTFLGVLLEACRGHLKMRASIAAPGEHRSPVGLADVRILTLGYGYDRGSSMHKGLQLITAADSKSCHITGPTRKVEGRQGSFQQSPRHGISLWIKSFLGMIFSMLLPHWIPNLKRLHQLEEEAVMVAEEAEGIAEVVEKVASGAEKVCAQVIDALPEQDGGKLRDAALFVERVSKEMAEDAHATQDFIHKVEDLKQDLKGLGTMVDPIIHELTKKKGAAKG